MLSALKRSTDYYKNMSNYGIYDIMWMSHDDVKSVVVLGLLIFC